MRSMDEIRAKLPYVRKILFNTYGSEITIGKLKGAVVFSNYEYGYEHVSFSAYNGKLPSWDDMCELKDIFFDVEEEAYQIMPKKSKYVNIKENCLHIWRPANGLTLDDVVKLKAKD